MKHAVILYAVLLVPLATPHAANAPAKLDAELSARMKTVNYISRADASKPRDE